jgi:Protein of unknown function (DUF1420)
LGELIARPPLPALVAILIAVAVATLAVPIAGLIRRKAHSSLDLAASFVLVTAVMCGLIHLLALAELGSYFVWILRIAGFTLAAIGAFSVVSHAGKIRAGFWELVEWYRRLSWSYRLIAALMGVVLIGYAALAVSPALDVDSLDYHLGVPLDWLRHGGAYQQSDWLEARFAALGEMMNALGIAVGSDCVGAVFQFSGLLMALLAVLSLAKSDDDVLLGSMLVLTAPVILYLVQTEKPQLFPSAITTLALVMLAERWEAVDRGTLVYVLVGCALAAGSKYSFILSTSIVSCIGLLAAYRAGILRFATIVALVAFIMLPGQVWIRNFFYYGDPISPLLETWKSHPDAVVAGFADWLHHWGFPLNWWLPLRLIATSHFGEFSSTLGVGTLAFVPALAAGSGTIFLVAASVLVFLTATLGQLWTRFLMEPYLWCSAASMTAPAGWTKRLLLVALVPQTVVVMLSVGFGVVSVFPGALTAGYREKVLQAYAVDYQVSEWANRILNPGDVVFSTLEANVYLNNDVADFHIWYPRKLLKERFAYVMKLRQPTVALIEYPLSKEDLDIFGGCLGPRIAGPASFAQGIRNPFNKRPIRSFQIVTVNAAQASCKAVLAFDTSISAPK